MRLANGVNPTSWHLTTARGELPLKVAGEHWLRAASGGLSSPAIEGFCPAYGGSRRLQIALSQAMSLPTPTAEGMEYRSTFTLFGFDRTFEGLFEEWAASETSGFRLVHGGARPLDFVPAQAFSRPTATANELDYHRSTFILSRFDRAFERLGLTGFGLSPGQWRLAPSSNCACPGRVNANSNR